MAGRPVLVVAAHPDDEVLGCGAAAARMVEEGCDVFLAILGEGFTSRFEKRESADRVLLHELHQHAKAAAAVIGAKDVFLYKLPDNRLDTVPLLEVVNIVETLVQKIKPEVIFTHHAGDLNVDHGVVNRAVITATRPTTGHPVREIYAFEVPSSTEWSFGSVQPIFRPNVFIDVSVTFEKKLSAMACYKTESRMFPHPRSPEALRANALRWGSVVGCDAAEAFELVRLIRPKEAVR